MNYELWLVSVPYLEWGVSRSAVCSGIMSKFHERDQIRVSPVVYLVITKYSEVLLEFLVDSFRFSVCLRVKSCGHTVVDLTPSLFHISCMTFNLMRIEDLGLK